MLFLFLQDFLRLLNGEVKQGIGGSLAKLFSHSASIAEKALVGAEKGLVISLLLGFSFRAPSRWLASEGVGGDYDPARTIQMVDISAAPTPNGLEHSLSVFAWLNPSTANAPTVDQFIEKFRNNPEMISFREIPPLAPNSKLATWSPGQAVARLWVHEQVERELSLKR